MLEFEDNWLLTNFSEKRFLRNYNNKLLKTQKKHEKRKEIKIIVSVVEEFPEHQNNE